MLSFIFHNLDHGFHAAIINDIRISIPIRPHEKLKGTLTFALASSKSIIESAGCCIQILKIPGFPTPSSGIGIMAPFVARGFALMYFPAWLFTSIRT